MRLLQIAIGVLITLGIAWAYISFYEEKAIYTAMPPVLDDIPWSENPKKPSHVATIHFLKPCGEPSIASNDDLIACFEKMGMETGQTNEGLYWATMSSGTGLMPRTHRIEWHSKAGQLPLQLDTYKEL